MIVSVDGKANLVGARKNESAFDGLSAFRCFLIEAGNGQGHFAIRRFQYHIFSGSSKIVMPANR